MRLVEGDPRRIDLFVKSTSGIREIKSVDAS